MDCHSQLVGSQNADAVAFDRRRTRLTQALTKACQFDDARCEDDHHGWGNFEQTLSGVSAGRPTEGNTRPIAVAEGEEDGWVTRARLPALSPHLPPESAALPCLPPRTGGGPPGLNVSRRSWSFRRAPIEVFLNVCADGAFKVGDIDLAGDPASRTDNGRTVKQDPCERGPFMRASCADEFDGYPSHIGFQAWPPSTFEGPPGDGSSVGLTTITRLCSAPGTA